MRPAAIFGLLGYLVLAIPLAFAEGRGAMLSANMIETVGLWIDQGAKNN